MVPAGMINSFFGPSFDGSSVYDLAAEGDGFIVDA
jgi:hypothetical protein